MQHITLTVERDKKRERKTEGGGERGSISWEERTTNKQWGGNIINRSSETIKQSKYEKCQAQVHEPMQEWIVTSVYEDKQVWARDRALVDANE